MPDFRLPALGSDMDSGTLLAWKVRPGDKVHRGDVVAVVDTSKAAVDIECWQDGTVAELLVQPGEKVPVGTVLARLLSSSAVDEATPSSAAATAAQAKRKTAPVTDTTAAAIPFASTDTAATVMTTPTTPTAAATPAMSTPAAGLIRASPAARKLAAAQGIALAAVPATGPGGAVTLVDVERAIAAGSAAVSATATAIATAATDSDDSSPAARQAAMRRTIAAAMSRSKREIPHYYLSETILLEPALNWLQRYNREHELIERMLTAVLLLKAVALACRQFPELNGHFRDGQFQPSAAIHVGVAIALRQGGLIAPAIHDVDQLSLPQLMQALTDLVQRTKAGTLRSSELTDATLTVTNLGEQGVDAVFGVIYPPQVAMIGFGRVSQQPWNCNGAVQLASVVTASLAADHRVSDGHRGALFLRRIGELLQQPEQW